MSTILDGRGRGFVAGVNSVNRMLVDAATITDERLATVSGQSFAFSTGLVVFTAATDSAVLFLKNTSDRVMIIDRLRVMLGTVTGGTGDWLLRIVRNPSEGTIVSNAVSAGQQNVNYGSSITPTGMFYRGVQGDTLTDGISSPFPMKSASDGQFVIEVNRVMPTGASFGLRLQPPTGTTAAQANIVARAYYPVGE